MKRTWVDETKDAAQGQWRMILDALGVAVPAMQNKHGTCPGCGGTDRFRFDDKNGRGTFICSNGGGEPVAGDGFRLLEHVHGWRFIESARRVAEVLGIDPQAAEVVQPTHSVQIQRRQVQVTRLLQAEHEAAEKRDRAQKSLDATLSACVPVKNVPAAWRYLTDTRGIPARFVEAAQDLLAHPGLPYFYKASKTARSQNLGTFPALVGVCRSLTGAVVTLHRTYLSSGGRKLSLPAPDTHGEKLDARKLMTPVDDQRYRIGLYEPLNGRLGVAEGIESALAAAILNDLPCDSAIDSGKLIHYNPPPGIHTLFIFADDDPAGRHGANSLKARMALDRPDLTVSIRYPMAHPGAKPGQDWNDVLLGVVPPSVDHRNIQRPGSRP